MEVCQGKELPIYCLPGEGITYIVCQGKELPILSARGRNYLYCLAEERITYIVITGTPYCKKHILI